MFSVFLMFLNLIIRSAADTDVNCVFMESCILPCSVQYGDEIVLHWFQMTPVYNRVHSFYHNQDQLGHQDQSFRGRTSLFQDQIFGGNVSLLLKMVKIQDQGRYICDINMISGNQELFIDLKVEAPVNKVNIDQVENRITCCSEGIYPEPKLTWSTRPPSSMDLQNTTSIQQTEQQLYNISSSLILPDRDTDVIYSCTISTPTNTRRSSLQRLSSASISSETTILCSSSNTSLTNLVWRFNHSGIIVTRTGPDVTYRVSEEWRQHVKEVSESGSITLQDLSPHQEGLYTCEVRDAEETMITETFLRISPGISNHVGLIAVLVLVVTAAVVGLVMIKKKKDQKETEGRTEETQTTMKD